MIFSKEINSINDLIQIAKETTQLKSNVVWFRGQADHSWSLQPNIVRRGLADKEEMYMKRFKQHALQFLARRPDDDWEWMFVMQHYGVPTRLLDWTESPLVGLFFAVSEEKYYDRDGALWCLLPTEFNKCSGIESAVDTFIPFFGVEPQLTTYRPPEYFMNTSSHLLPVAALSFRDTPRIQAQHGIFTIHHRKSISLEEISPDKTLGKIIIPAGSKMAIKEELEFFQICKHTLFPELDNIAEYSWMKV